MATVYIFNIIINKKIVVFFLRELYYIRHLCVEKKKVVSNKK